MTSSPLSHACRLLIDARECLVKSEIYRVAGRYHLQAVLISAVEIGAPFEPWLTKVVVDEGHILSFISSEAHERDIVITENVELVALLRKNGRCHHFLNNKGQRWTEKGLVPPLSEKSKGNFRARFVSVLEDEVLELLRTTA